MVRPAALRVILDTNIVVRGLIDEKCPSGLIMKACESRDLIPVLSKPLLLEYREILMKRSLAEVYPQLTRSHVEMALERLVYLGDVVRRLKRFEFPRDPKDAKLIELMLSGKVTNLISTDKDLLDLPARWS